MNHPYHKIVLFGDSITQFSFDPLFQGFGASIANAYQRKIDVMNRGFSGYNTTWAIPILRQLLPTVEQQKQPAKIQLLTIFFGANDGALPISFQHVPLEKYKKNLEELISMVRSPSSPYYNPSLRLVLITPPPINEVQWKVVCEENGIQLDRKFETTRLYAECARNVGKEHKIPVINLWDEILDRAKEQNRDLSQFLSDGLHLSSLGNQTAYELFMEVINTHFPELHPDALEMELPYFRDIDPKNYLDALQFKLIQKE
ncbi:SGNH hydrolase-type esterase domain-containing protein [Phycomyces blakesleeanus]|uniref:SGNH hydrolase-type esterase domain-containing protein n=2 Tax=Phycomyces blakesleeanus TaxID=4837 RepID=A0A167JE47_PHYB8|nr:hypothetical protein PHYBLDRAFT_137566 [Phycomyces blakesleeanus NRRL 1555(-)]OAD65808.1 hypothetical protein PHYBLDRAFT_137566 [Phycomyces blakesleeanus NRRL 1555(-)]|eukprot:XP_018283848.1 hypothetical protein PHYBLDRAFT_137566 [Phycomyces blakesleeanus NRRL 1555(-)]